jgi:hypothetical protein
MASRLDVELHGPQDSSGELPAVVAPTLHRPSLDRIRTPVR